MKAIFKRELTSYFNNMTGYIFTAFTVFIIGIYVMYYCLKNGYPYFEYVVSNVEFFYLMTIPVLTMKVVAEDKKQRTDQLLYSLPLSMRQIVLGKFFAMTVVLFLPVIELLILPPILNIYGNIALGTAYSSIFAYYMLGLALTAIGLFISSLTDNQLAAASITFVIVLASYLMTGLSSYIPGDSFSSYISFAVIILLACIVIWFMTKSKAASLIIFGVAEACLLLFYAIKKTAFEGLIHKVISGISLFDKADNFFNGIFDLTGMVYFLSVIVLFIFLTIQSMEKRRWS